MASGPRGDSYEAYQEYVRNNERGTVLETLIDNWFYRNIKDTKKFKIVNRSKDKFEIIDGELTFRS